MCLISLCFCCFYFDDAAFDRCRGVLHTPQFISGQTSLAAAAALTFFCSFSCVKTRKGEEQGFCLFSPCQDRRRRRTGALPLFPLSRQEKNRGFAPFTPTFFSSLDGRKEGKRRSRRQGRRPSLPDTRALPSTLYPLPSKIHHPNALSDIHVPCTFIVCSITSRAMPSPRHLLRRLRRSLPCICRQHLARRRRLCPYRHLFQRL